MWLHAASSLLLTDLDDCFKDQDESFGLDRALLAGSDKLEAASDE